MYVYTAGPTISKGSPLISVRSFSQRKFLLILQEWNGLKYMISTREWSTSGLLKVLLSTTHRNENKPDVSEVSKKNKLKKIQWQRSLAERKSEQLMDPKTITFFTFHPKLLPLLHPDNQDHKLQIEEHLEFVFLSLAASWLVCFTAFA